MSFQSKFSSVEREQIVTGATKTLWEPSGKIGLDYLTSTRKIKPETIKKFQIGYVPATIDHQLAGRIIMPVYDASYNLIALSTRRVVAGVNEYMPDYWHEQYEKSLYLYGLHLAINSARKLNYCILVEGQFDCLQLHNIGISNTVAVCGSKISEWQVSLILRYCSYMLVMFDIDKNETGQKSSQKYVDQFEQRKYRGTTYGGKELHGGYCMVRVVLPCESDPDEYIKEKGSESIKSIIEEKIVKTKEKCNVYL